MCKNTKSYFYDLDTFSIYGLMGMNLLEALDILEIKHENTTSLTMEYLKSRYHRLALKNHPDKNGNTMESKERFQKINEAYELWKREISILEMGDNERNAGYNDGDIRGDTPTAFDYSYFVHLFIDGLMHGSLNTIIKGIVNDSVAFSLDKLNKENALTVYNFIFKYQSVLHIREETLDKIKSMIIEKFDDLQIYILNPTLDDLFSNNIYKLEIDGTIYYVPLWHSELYFDDNVIVKCIPDLPENIALDEDNNIIVHVNISFTFSLLVENFISISLGKCIFNIPVEQLFCKRVQTYTIKKGGISRIDTELYNIETRGDIIFKITMI